MPARTPVEIECFVLEWVAEHVRFRNGPANLLLEVDRLASLLTHDARAYGVSGGDIFRTLGDIDVYLMEKCEQVIGKGAPRPSGT